MWMHSNQHTVYYCCKFFVSSSVTQKDIHTKMILHSLHIFLYWQKTQTAVCEFTTRSREMITVHLWFKYTRINMQKSTIEKQPTTISHKNTSRMSRLISPPSVTHTEYYFAICKAASYSATIWQTERRLNTTKPSRRFLHISCRWTLNCTSGQGCKTTA